MVGTPLKQARRHVAEGRRRIKEQEDRIGKLQADGHQEKLKQSRELLAILRDGQNIAEHYLSTLEREARSRQ